MNVIINNIINYIKNNNTNFDNLTQIISNFINNLIICLIK